MAFKINISHNGKTYKVETESEFLVGKKIGEIVKGGEINDNLKGYELEITGTSDLSGIPGFKGLEGPGYHRRLLTYGKGMKDVRKGIRLKKTHRREEISLKTHQINIKVVKEGEKKFSELVGGGKEGGEGGAEEKSEEASPGEEKEFRLPPQEEKTKEAPKEEVKEEKGNSERDKDESKSSESGDSGSNVVEDTKNENKGNLENKSEGSQAEGENQSFEDLSDTNNVAEEPGEAGSGAGSGKTASRSETSKEEKGKGKA